eukprot:328872-Ditylum_brightwellii.AAC.1
MALLYRDTIMTVTDVPGYQLVAPAVDSGAADHGILLVLPNWWRNKRVFLGCWGGGGDGAEMHVLAPHILWLTTAMMTTM